MKDNKKYALVTGASRGIGLAVATYLAREGYQLALIARRKKPLKQLQEKLQVEHGISVHIRAVDLENSHNAYKAAKQLITELGHVDILFNNAGIFLSETSSMSIENFSKTMHINMFAAFAVAKATSEYMKKQNSGYIINVASMAGKHGLALGGGYCASKFALVGFSQSLGRELDPYGIKVTAICPSVIDTDMTKHFELENAKKIRPEDIVQTVDYLLNLSPNAVIDSIDVLCRAII